MHFLLCGNQNGKGCSPDISSKRHSACCALEKFLGAKKYSSIYKFSILSGLDETLVPYNLSKKKRAFVVKHTYKKPKAMFKF